MFYLNSIILQLVTYFVDLAAEMYQFYSLRMVLWGVKHVRVTYRVNKVVWIIYECACRYLCDIRFTNQLSISVSFEVTYKVKSTVFFIIKPTRCTNFTNLFCHETLHVSENFSVHHQEFIHCTLSNVPSWSCSKAVYKPVWHIPLLSVQWINSWRWTEELSKPCWVSCQNKFVKFVHLFGFYYKEICCDARAVGFIIKKFVTMHVHLVGFIIKKFVTMHGHMNVKKYNLHTYGSFAKDRSNWAQLSSFWNARKKVKVKQERESSSDVASRNKQGTYGDFGTA